MSGRNKNMQKSGIHPADRKISNMILDYFLVSIFAKPVLQCITGKQDIAKWHVNQGLRAFIEGAQKCVPLIRE